MGIEVTGKIHHIGETQHVSDRFSKREFVLELADNPKYPQHVAFELAKDKCGDIDDYEVGDEVRVEFSLRGREWRSPKGETKYFNTLSVWKIERRGEKQASKPAGASDVQSAFGDGPDDSIPF